jgi:hypothetical protein
LDLINLHTAKEKWLRFVSKAMTPFYIKFGKFNKSLCFMALANHLDVKIKEAFHSIDKAF